MTKITKYFSYTFALLGIWFSIFFSDVSLSKKSLEQGMENEIKTVSSLLAMALDKTTPMTDILTTANKVLDKSVMQELYFESSKESKKILNTMLLTDSGEFADVIQRFTVVEIAKKVAETTSLNMEKTNKKIAIFNGADEIIFPNNWVSVDFESLYKSSDSYSMSNLLSAFLPEDPVKPIEFHSSCKAASSPIVFKKKSSPPFYDFANDRRVVCKDIVSDKNERLGYVVLEDSYYQAPFWSHLLKKSYLLPFVLLGIIFLLLIEAKNTAVRYQIKQLSSFIVELGRVRSVYATPVVPPQLKIDQGFRTLAKSIRRLRKKLEHKETLEIDLHNIAHQLDNNLGSATGDIENYKAGITNAEEALESSGAKIGRVKTLLERLLDIAHLNATKKSDYKDSVDLSDVISTVISDYNSQIKEKSLIIRSQLTSGVIILGDYTLLVSAFSNIFHNAIKHSPHAGEIEFQIKCTNHNIQVLILDSGVGLSESTFDRIENNEMFSNQHPSIKEKGHGLGIRHSKAVFQLHNAEFTISNRHFKAGASASVRFYTDNRYIDDDSREL